MRKYMAQMLTLNATLEAKEGKEELLKTTLLALVAPSRAEAGCIDYDVHEDPEHKGRFMFYENWASKEDLDKHFQMPYMQTFMAQIEELLARPIDMSFWQMISETNRR